MYFILDAMHCFSVPVWSPDNPLPSVVLQLSQLLEAFVIKSYPSFDVEEGEMFHHCPSSSTPTHIIPSHLHTSYHHIYTHTYITSTHIIPSHLHTYITPTHIIPSHLHTYIPSHLHTYTPSHLYTHTHTHTHTHYPSFDVEGGYTSYLGTKFFSNTTDSEAILQKFSHNVVLELNIVHCSQLVCCDLAYHKGFLKNPFCFSCWKSTGICWWQHICWMAP